MQCTQTDDSVPCVDFELLWVHIRFSTARMLASEEKSSFHRMRLLEDSSKIVELVRVDRMLESMRMTAISMNEGAIGDVLLQQIF